MKKKDNKCNIVICHIILNITNNTISEYAIANGEPLKTVEVYECRRLYTLLIGMNKTIVLQWNLGHCSILGNKHADALAKKGTMILQTIHREISFHTVKSTIKNKLKAALNNELQERILEKR